MSLATSVLLACGGTLLALAALAALVRIVRGPTILDRMIASDMLLTTLMLALGTDMVVRGHTDTIPLMAVIAATAVLATIAVARHVRRRAGEGARDWAAQNLPPREGGHDA